MNEPLALISRRNGPEDRRVRPTPAVSRYLFRGRRRRARREADACRGYYVDHPGPRALAAGFALMLLTVLDGVFTLRLLDGGATEENPLMAYALSAGISSFLITKYLLTVPSVGVLLLHKNFPVVHPRFRAKWVVVAFISVYAALIGYEIALLGLLAEAG